MLAIMRHGQASFGAAHYDRLSELGMAQARTTGEYLRAQGAKHGELCVGPRDRHHGTARALLDAWGASPVRRDEARVDEFADSAQILAAMDDAAPWPEGAASSGHQRLQRLMDGIDAWAGGRMAIAGCETFAQFRSRIGRWLHDELETASHKAPRLVVTSAGVVAAVFCEVLQLPDEAFPAIVCQVRNASLTEVGTTRGRAVVVSFNNTGHLPARLVTSI